MDTTLIIAIVSAVGSVAAAIVSYHFSRKREIEADWRNQKLTHYRELLSALSDTAIHGINHSKAQERFANAFNTIALVAPQAVLQNLLNFHDEIRHTNPNPSKKRHDDLLTSMVYEIRKDLGIMPQDDFTNFTFRLIGKAPEKKV